MDGGHTKRNLLDVEDQAPRFGLDGVMQSRFARAALDCERTGMAHFRIAPGRRVPFGHRHHEQEEIYVVLAGSGRARLDDEEVAVGPLDALRVAPGVTRCFEAGPEGLEYLAFGAPSTGRADEAEMLPGWWGDRPGQ